MYWVDGQEKLKNERYVSFFISSDRSSLRDDALRYTYIESFSDAPWHYITTLLLSINKESESERFSLIYRDC